MAEDKMIEKVEHQSKIVSLRIENFMSIKKAFLDFTDSNIISLCGYNDSGKSAITRLFEVMFYNTYSTDHVKFITDGEDYWLGELTFSDGVVYTRIKYSDGKSLYELRKGDIVLYTNKLPNGTMAAIGDIPETIVKYLGVIQDDLTGEELNVRRNTDRLFLINTSGGDNYKILNSVLRSDVLSSASKSLNDDKNKLNNEVNEKKTVQGVLQEQYDSYDIPPEEEMNELKDLMSKLDESKSRLMTLLNIIEILKTLSSISIYDSLQNLDVARIEMLQNIMELSKSKNVPISPILNSVDLLRVQALQNIMQLKMQLNSKTYPALEMIDIERVRKIVDLGESFNTYKGTERTYNKVVQELENVKSQLKKLSDENNLKICQNCGAVVA